MSGRLGPDFMSAPAFVVKRPVTTRTPHIPSRIKHLVAATLALVAVTGVLAGTASADSTPALPPLNFAVSTSNMTPAGNLPFVQGTVYAVNYVITDTANAKLTDVSFSDQLPAGVTVAPGTTATALNCGNFTPQSESGASAITVSNFTVYGNSPNHCAIEYFVVASTVEGTTSDTPGTVTWTDDGTPEPSSDVNFPSWTVSVTTPPTMAITTPINGATYAFNQKVTLALTATAGPGDTITPGSVYAVDNNGYEYTNGQTIPTNVPGVHTLTVWAQTEDGFYGAGAQSVKYTVDSPKPVHVVSHPLGSLSYDIEYLANGRVTATLSYDGETLSQVKKWVHVGKEMPMWLSPNATAQQILKRHPGGIDATLTLEYQVWNYHSFTNTPVNVIEDVHIN